MARPMKITVDDLKDKIESYYQYCMTNNKPLTMSGLAFYLDMSRTTLYNYENELKQFNGMSREQIDELVNTVKRAKRMVEMYQEECLFNGKNPAGIIFSLKNNFNWKDIQEVNNTIVSNPYEKLTEAELRKLIALEENNNRTTEPTSEVNTLAEYQENNDI